MEKIKVFEKMQEINNNTYINDKIGVDCFTDYIGGNNYICDIIMEISDYNVDIYNYDLLEWLKDNYTIVEESNDELGCPSNDIIAQVQQAQFYDNENCIYEKLENILLYTSYYILYSNNIQEITQEQDEKLSDFISSIDNNDCLFSDNDILNTINIVND